MDSSSWASTSRVTCRVHLTQGTLRPEDVPADYRALLDYANRGASVKPVLVGVSEGAGLSILAAADPRMHIAAAGVVGVGLPVTTSSGGDGAIRSST